MPDGVPTAIIILAPSPYIYVAKNSVHMLLPTQMNVVQIIFRVHIFLFYHGLSVNIQITLRRCQYAR